MPPLRPATCVVLVAWRPRAHLHLPLCAVDEVEQYVRHANSVAMVLPIGISRRVEEVDCPSHAIEVHALDQRVKQLTANDLRFVLNLEQVMQSMGDSKDSIITKGVIS
eukprot:7097197-Prymnesium_polylepis.1